MSAIRKYYARETPGSMVSDRTSTPCWLIFMKYLLDVNTLDALKHARFRIIKPAGTERISRDEFNGDGHLHSGRLHRYTVLNPQLSALSLQLRRYFYSGWAFSIPYLAVYLLYAWFKWPVNPASELMKGESGRAAAAGMWIPSLLYVYWILHALHLVLAAIALRSWWNGASPSHSASDAAVPPSHSRPATRYSLLRPLLPWALLALVFYVPGVYLEWPSDPWEHLRRINEWHAVDIVTHHTAWAKSSYFLTYSLTGHLSGLTQFSLLNVWYVGICLLLSWQYYRLARSVGLGERGAFLFVILNALSSGNSIFSFYRYYGLSSSVLAQLGAVALARCTVDACRDPGSKRVFHFLLPSALLLAFTAFNHIQGVGLAGLGIGAALIWGLANWNRAIVGWMAGLALLLSGAVVLWLPRDPALASSLRSQGWLTAWYGFDLFSPGSPAFDRSFHILGAFGVVNLLAAIVLVSRNHPAGWLTIAAPLMLIAPCTAIPFANALVEQDTILSGEPDGQGPLRDVLASVAYLQEVADGVPA